jgi:hypothetical protein
MALLAACSSGPSPTGPTTSASVPDAAVRADAGVEWLKGNTHAHALPSGDSIEPVHSMIRWYRERGYDFLVLTDHNRVSQVDIDVVATIQDRVETMARASQLGPDGGVPDAGTTYRPTAGQIVVHDDELIVFAGVELTYNPIACTEPDPPPDGGRCRIHANLIGVTARPVGKLEWANRESLRRVDSYQAALDQAEVLGGIMQINHPAWWWGMTADLLLELARRGVTLVEISNVQFQPWNRGDPQHPSIEAMWDAALTAGVDIWGIASDDAHDYDEVPGGGKYPAGGGWIVVRARRDPTAIFEAIRAGDFYASTGVVLADVEVADGELVVAVADDDPGEHVITFIGDGQVLSEQHGRKGRQPLAETSYVRAVVTRDDGARAWTQPERKR